MDVEKTKLELINLLLNEQKERVLMEVKSLLLRDGKKEEQIIKDLLKESEKQYANGEYEPFQNIIEESKKNYSK
ncbi:hypothetical protein HX109_03465 [Galbibacter sp. BG1]|uniref:hypothetical protein n=1 Tax=Galbibacter sp. BG1 TaxID=1170699 RepID=UPI0015B898D7|nr:hypothetical protein [Galbibacter sp. BG1]QLE00666.1 hypothetical protein HX109_03465 [Galbibacter sp. BG1]